MTLGTMLVLIICDPEPPVPVNQPPKAEPVLDGVGSVPNCAPGVKLDEAGETEPPSGFQVMVTGLTVHLA